mgnify:CR=1 FL=1
MNTETIDKLFLELSQFTTARTEREIELRELNAELLRENVNQREWILRLQERHAELIAKEVH